MNINRNLLLLTIIISIAAIFRFFNLLHDEPYFFDPDERNMAIAISQFRLPDNPFDVPACLLSQLTAYNRLKTSNCNLNPRFFAYGQFPLYLAYFSSKVVSLPVCFLAPKLGLSFQTGCVSTIPFPMIIYWLRFWSAFASTATVLFVFLITKKFAPAFFALIASLFTAFLPGLIQSAHFGTTESFLTLFFIISVFLSMKIIDLDRSNNLGYLKNLFFLSLTIGLALGSKLTGIFFMIPPAIALLFALGKEISGKKPGRKKRNILNVLLFYGSIAFLIVIGSGIFFVISSPYNLIDLEGFKGSVFGYEADVATGKYEAFYTRQFVDTIPILFQAEKIFPYALGLPVFILGTLGFLLISLNLIINITLFILSKIKNLKLKIKNYKKKFKILDFHFPCLRLPAQASRQAFSILHFAFCIYFIPNAFLFAKWTRFMTPIFPFFAIFAGYFFFKVNNFFVNFYLKSQNSVRLNTLFHCVIVSLYIVTLLPGIAFMSIYTHEDSRVTASRWIYENIPSDSYVLSETANVIDIPLQIPGYQFISRDYNLTVISFDFYHMDEDFRIFPELLNHLTKADYIFIPSRRIFANHPRQAAKYPLVTKYYQLLFSGRLGFEKVSEISSFPTLSLKPPGRWPNGLLPGVRWEFPDENAEETFTVFDHPVIRIYKKVESKSTETYRELFRI